MTNITTYDEQNQDLQRLKEMAFIALKSGKYGADFNESTILNIFLTAKALDVDPMLALNGGFNIIQGKINMGAHFMSALVRRQGHSIKVIEMTEQKCTIIAKRKDNDDSLKYEMTMKEASQAGLTGKKNWMSNPKQMLYCACVRNVFRILFSDIAIPYDADEMNVEEKLEQPEDVGLINGVPDNNLVIPTKIIDSRAVSDVPEASESLNPLDELKNKMKADGLSSDRLEEWLKMRCEQKNQTLEQAIQICLVPETFGAFKKSFAKWINTTSQSLEASA